jgi:CheY-like chemotaxis protein
MISSGAGTTLVAEKSARRAAHLLEDGSIDALITDLRMPEMDGLELLAIARKFLVRFPVSPLWLLVGGGLVHVVAVHAHG